MERRRPTNDEIRLIDHLISVTNDFQLPDDWQHQIFVQEMLDGGMGSLRLFLGHHGSEKRLFGRQTADCIFKDIDGVEVIASLYLDQTGDLFELDIWKTDFSKLRKIPSSLSKQQIIDNAMIPNEK